MKIKLLIMVMSTLLFSTAAYSSMIINYSISGSDANYSGQFTVNALTDTILLNPASGSGSASAGVISYTGGSNPTFPIGVFFLSAPSAFNPGSASWYSGDYSSYFQVNSLDLYSSLAPHGTNATWNDLLGTFTLNNTSYYTTYLVGGTTYGHAFGGTITFAESGGGAVATPEPGTMMLLGSGVLTFGLSRFRRRKQEVVA